MDAKPKRRWYQFSLRTFFVLVTIVCIGFGWFGLKVRAKVRERAAVEAITKLGGIVSYDYQYYGVTPPGPAWLRKLFGDDFFANVHYVSIDNPQFTDAGLVYVQQLKQLKRLYLYNTQVTDAGLVHLHASSQLVNLNLEDSQVTSEGLEKLKGLTQLVTLSLNNTQVTDAGLVHLEGLNRLVWLDLARTHVSDLGLETLKGLTQLKILTLSDTEVTDAGCQELQKALPNLQINR